MKKYTGSVEGEERRVRRINVIDVALIVVFLCIVLVAIEYFTSFSLLGLGDKTQLLEYTLELEGVDPDMAHSVAAGSRVLASSGYKDMGEVISVSEKPAVMYVYDPAEGALVARELPADAQGKTPVTLYVTVRAEASYREGDGFSVNGVRISIGESISVSLDGLSGTGKCISIYGAAAQAEEDS